MAGLNASYNPEVLAQTCSKCGSAFPIRCVGSVGQVTKAHYARLTAAGYRWAKGTYVLERIPSEDRA